MGKSATYRIVVLLFTFVLVMEMVPMIHASPTQAPISQNIPSQPNAPSLHGDTMNISSLGLLQTGQIQFSISFSIRNSQALNSYIESSHKQVHGIQPVLTEQQFEAEYSPTQADYDRVIAFLSAQNLSVTQTYSNRLLLTAEGSVADIQRAFGTQIGLFSYMNTTFYKSINDITVPASLGTYGIAGININSFPATPCLTRVSGTPNTIAPNGIAFDKSPSDFRDAYGTNTAIQGGWTGIGTTIAIVDAYGDPTISSDMNLFNAHFGLPSLALTISGTGGTDSGWATETAIDVEWAHAMAPGAGIILQVCPDNSWNNLIGAVNTLVGLTNHPDIISLSWGGSEFGSYYASVFAAAAAKGIKVYVSTGDDGAYNDESSLAVQYPAVDPNVIAVGGTTLYSNTVQGTNEYYEYGWSVNSQGKSSGGGYSSFFSEPSYQTSAGIPDPTGMRAIPDVSLDGDPNSGVTIYVGGSKQTGWGGTSLAAPMMAGIASVALNGGWNLDNYGLYGIYNTNKYQPAFHDVYLSGYNGYYYVQSGWDAVTGLGSINLHNFVNINYENTGSGVLLTGQSLSPSTITRGQSITMGYTIINPDSDYSLIQIGLGANIRLHGTTTAITDSANDVYVTLPGNSSAQSRQFATSSSLTPGYYDVQWQVWMGPPGMGNLLSSSGWQMNQLLITQSSSDFYFSVGASPSSSIVTPGGPTTYSVTSTLTSGSSQSVSLSCSPSITGVSYLFSPSSGNPTFSSTLTVQTSSNTPSGTYTLTITGNGGGKTYSTTVQLAVGDSYEPDDSFSQYSSMSVATSLQSQSRSIEPAGDNDYIRFYATPGTYLFYTSGSTDTYGYLYDSNQNLLTSDDDSGGNLQFEIVYSIPTSGYYFLRISGYSTSTQGLYTLYYSYAPSPLSPNLISPANGAIMASTSVAFSYGISSGATSYQIQVIGPSSGTYNTTTTSYIVQSLSSGSYTWRARAYNSIGWSDWTPTWSFILDTTPPSTPNPDDGVSGWSTSNIPTFTWPASTDTGSGVAGYYWKVDSGVETWTTSTSVTLTSQSDGSHTFYIKAKDNAGNNSTYGYHVFQIDTTPPSGTILINQGSSYTSSASVILTITYSDATSGVDKVRFSNDGVWDTKVWETPSATQAWTLSSGDGTKTVYYQIRDNAGQLSSTYSTTIILDTSPPAGSIIIDNGAAYTNSTTVTLALSATDATSGVGSMQFSNDNTTWSGWETYASLKAWTIQSGDGTKNVCVQYRDNVGLVTTYSNSIILDTIAPTANAGQGQTVTQGNSVTFDASSSSSDSSGIVSYVWDFGDGSQGSGMTTTHTYASPGNYVAKLTVQDSAGNTATATVNIVVQQQPTPPPTLTSSSSSSQTSNTQPTPTPHATPTPSPTPSSTATPSPTTVEASTDSGSTVALPISGNITSSQIFGAIISTNQSAATTTISFNLTGQSGTTGFCNVTVPKSVVPYGTTPTIYIDHQICQDQGYTQDTINYYVWYVTHFSTHEVSIVFTAKPSNSEFPLWAILALLIIVVVSVVAVLMQRKRGKANARKRKKKSSKAGSSPTPRTILL